MEIAFQHIGTAALAAAAIISLAAACAADLGDFDAAPYGTPYKAKTDGKLEYAPGIVDPSPDTAVDVAAGESAQIEWRHPRDIYAVNLTFDGRAPRAGEFRLKWYYHVWPDNGRGGWMRVDDPFNGRFVDAVVDIDDSRPDALRLWIKPLETDENPDVRQTGFDFRRTYKVRVEFDVPARLVRMECFTDSRWQHTRLKIELLKDEWDGALEARNAEVVSVRPLGGSAVMADLRYADNPNRLSPDRGHVVVRRSGKGQDFSFFVDDVVRDGAIYVRDIEAYICTEANTQSYNTWAGPEGVWDDTVIERVAKMPEQTFETAMRLIPPKLIDHAHLGLPGLRQEMSIDPSSQIYSHPRSLRGLGSDTDRAPLYPGTRSYHVFRMITRQEPFEAPEPDRIERRLEDGYLPLIHSKWTDDGVDYHQSVFAAALDPAVTARSLASASAPERPIGSGIHAANFGAGCVGDEPIAILSRLSIKNTTGSERSVEVWFAPDPAVPMTLSEDGLIVLDAPTRKPAGENLTPVRGQIVTNGRGSLTLLANHTLPGSDSPRDYIRYTLSLPPGGSHTLFVKVPYLEQLTGEEIDQLKALDWEESRKLVLDGWSKRLAGAVNDYSAPEPMLVDLWRANLWHVLIGTDRDPSTGLYQHGAATYNYASYANEAMMVARMLEMRGEHEEARRLIEPYLLSQGTKPLPGNFKSTEGLLYAAAPPEFDYYTAQGYNMHHGFVLWAAAEHYLWTRDRAYLEAVSPNLIAACDWVTRERRATMTLNPDGTRPVEYGLAPAGDLEDVEEYLYFYATNAYYYLGMKTAADVLAEIGHPEAGRIAADAAAYADDIMASVREATATSPVVQLLDGSYVPYVPPRAYALTDRKEGWIREALYCALHLVDCGLTEADSPLAEWVLQALEDRIFLSEESGVPPERMGMSLEDFFFTFGGYNPQPNLLDTSIAYLKRGQPAHFVRAFFNIFAGSIHPDMVCFSECAAPYSMTGYPLYKTPDESKFIQYMRQMLILEMGPDILIGAGVPLAWTEDGKSVELRNAGTYFGPMNVKIGSAAAQGSISADIDLPTRNRPRQARVFLRHPEGRPIKSVTVNGRSWDEFDAGRGCVTIPGDLGKADIVARF